MNSPKRKATLWILVVIAVANILFFGFNQIFEVIADVLMWFTSSGVEPYAKWVLLHLIVAMISGMIWDSYTNPEPESDDED